MLHKAARALFLLIVFSLGIATAQQSYNLEVFINEIASVWQAAEPARQDGNRLVVPPELASVEISFSGGKIEINLQDFEILDEAHVLGVSYRKTGAESYSFSATVRHRDEGWEHYADAFEIMGDEVQNGLRVLVHPHDNEQPFTRSQSAVIAAGLVRIEANDSVHGRGGSVIYLDLSSAELKDQEQFSVRFALTPLD